MTPHVIKTREYLSLLNKRVTCQGLCNVLVTCPFMCEWPQLKQIWHVKFSISYNSGPPNIMQHVNFFFPHLTIELNMHKRKTQGTIKFLNNALTSQSTLTWTIEEDVQYRNIMTSTEPIHQLLWIDINLFWKASEGKHFSKAWDESYIQDILLARLSIFHLIG